MSDCRRCLRVWPLVFALLFCTSGTIAHAQDVPLDAERLLPLFWSDEIPVVNLFWHTDWDNVAGHEGMTRDAIDDALVALLDSDYFDGLDEYGVPPLRFLGSIETRVNDNLCGDVPAGQVSTAELLLFVECELFLNPIWSQLPLIDFQPPYNIVNLFVPAGTTILDDLTIEIDGEPQGIRRESCEDYAAYHAFTPLSLVNNLPLHYLTILPIDCQDDLDEVTASLSHEIVEAATDPIPLAHWIDLGSVSDDVFEFLTQIPGLVADIPSLLVEGELADICETDVFSLSFAETPLGSDPDSIVTGSYWSNEQNACVIGRDRVVASFFRADGIESGNGRIFIGSTGRTLPVAQMLREGTPYFYQREEVGPGQRFEPLEDCSGFVTFPDGNVTADAEMTVGCDYQEQFLLEVVVNPTGASDVVTVTGDGWKEADTIVDVEVESPALDGPSRWVFRQWAGPVLSGDPATTVLMSDARLVIAYYDLQHQISFTQSGITTVTPWPLTIGATATSGPAEAWADDGGELAFSYGSPVNADPGTRFVLDGVSHESPLRDVSAPTTVVASYHPEYLIQFLQSGIPSGVPWTLFLDGLGSGGPQSHWLAAGSTVAFSYPGLVLDSSDAATRYRLTGVSRSSPLTSTAPTTVLGTYGTEYALRVQAQGLPGSLAVVTNGGSALGTISDDDSILAWLASGTPLDLRVTDPVDGAEGVQYFFDRFDPTPPVHLAAGFTTTARYRTMGEVIDAALESGTLEGFGLANALRVKFEAAEAAIGRGDFADALGPLGAFIRQVAAQSSMKIEPSAADELTLDVAAVLHSTLCKAVGGGQLTAEEEQSWRAFYENAVLGAGGVPESSC